MADRELMDWEHFRSAFIEPGGGTYVVPGSPRVELRAETGGALVLVVPCDDVSSLERFRLENLEVRSISNNGASCARLEVRPKALHAPFYKMACHIADYMQLRGLALGDAVERTLDAWARLISTTPKMSEEAERGLWGELAILEYLLGAAPARKWVWTGPEGDDHDFRFGGFELEVKTHLGSVRQHWISNLGQLVPSPGQELFIVSLLLAVSPTGETLPQLVSRVRAAATVPIVARLNECLKVRHYRDEEAVHYAQRLILRSPPAVVPLGTDLPRLTRGHLDRLFPSGSDRIRQAKYLLDVDGLEHLPNSAEFERVLPGFGR